MRRFRLFHKCRPNNLEIDFCWISFYSVPNLYYVHNNKFNNTFKMKKILSLLIILIVGVSSCTPVKYVMMDPKDTTKLVEVRKRIVYDYDYYQMPMYFGYGRTYYNPIIIGRFNYPKVQPRFERRTPTRKR